MKATIIIADCFIVLTKHDEASEPLFLSYTKLYKRLCQRTFATGCTCSGALKTARGIHYLLFKRVALTEQIENMVASWKFRGYDDPILEVTVDISDVKEHEGMTPDELHNLLDPVMDGNHDS